MFSLIRSVKLSTITIIKSSDLGIVPLAGFLSGIILATDTPVAWGNSWDSNQP